MMPVWIGKIERDKGAADIRQSLSMRNNICGRHCSLELSFYRFLSTSGHTTGHPQCPARRHPAFRSSPGGLRRRASVGRQSVSCFHTQPVGDTHGSLFTPTSPPLRAAVPVLRPVPRLPPAYFYNAIFPFIIKIVRPGRFTFLLFSSTPAHRRTPANARHADTLCSVPVRVASGAGRAWAGRVCHASTHSLSETPTVRSSPRLPLLSGLPCLCCGQSRDFRRCLL